MMVSDGSKLVKVLKDHGISDKEWGRLYGNTTNNAITLYDTNKFYKKVKNRVLDALTINADYWFDIDLDGEKLSIPLLEEKVKSLRKGKSVSHPTIKSTGSTKVYLANYNSFIANEATAQFDYRTELTLFQGVDFVVPAASNTLSPMINSGDYLFISRISTEQILPGAYYLIISKNLGAGTPVVYRINFSTNDGEWILDNNADDFNTIPIDKDKIERLYLIKYCGKFML